MAEVDTSSYPKTKNTNPLVAMTGFANLQNVMNQNRLFQQQFQTNLGLGKIYKSAINPQTGEFDPSKVDLNDPDVTYGLPQAMQQAQQMRLQKTQIDTQALQNAQQHLERLTGYLAPLMKPGATSTDVASALAHAKTNGIATDKEILDTWLTLPRDPQTGQVLDNQIPAWAQAQQLRVLNAQERLNFFSPKPEMQELPGGGKAPFVMPQGAPVQQVGPTIQPAPSPTTTTVGPDGTPRYIGNPQGNNPYEPGGGQGQGGGMAPGGNIAGLPAGMSPAASAASTETGGASAKQLASLREEVHGAPNRVLMSQQALKALDSAMTGKGSQGIQNWRSVLSTLGISTPGNDKASMSFDEAKKYMLGAMLSRGAGLGINTNEKLAALSGASASTDINKLAAKDILGVNIGLEKAQMAQAAAFDKTGLPPEQFSKWAADWARNRDLRVYAMAGKSGSERAKFLESLKPGERQKFVATLKEAVDTNTLPLSDFQK